MRAKWVLVLPAPWPAQWLSKFEPLITYRQAHGYEVAVGYVNQILASYPGDTDQQKVRNYLKEQGARWALLAGDDQLVPMMDVGVMCSGADMLTNEYDILNDWYYCDLDGEWPRQNDPWPGGFDWTPECWAGRVPCMYPAEAENFVDKVLVYEQNPGYGNHAGYLDRTFYEYADNQQRDLTCDQVIGFQDPTLEYVLWGEDPSWDHPDPDFPWDYEIVGELSGTSPPNYCHYNIVSTHCHGGPELYANLTYGDYEGTKNAFGQNDVAALDNSGYYFFWYSTCCRNADLRESVRTLAETSTCVYEGRGAIAFAGNTGFGESPESAWLQCCAWEYLYPDGPYRKYHNHAGCVEAMSKFWYDRKYVHFTGRYICWSHNLFGDPATGIWTPIDQPGSKGPTTARDALLPLRINWLGCGPNPVTGHAVLEFCLTRSATVRLTAYDVAGRLVQVVEEGVVADGPIARRWDCSELPAGAYVVRLEAEGVEAKRKAVALR